MNNNIDYSLEMLSYAYMIKTNNMTMIMVTVAAAFFL